MTKDPSRLERNLYLYSRANPTNFSDPAGLFSKEIVEKSLSLNTIGAIANNWTNHPHWGLYLLLRNAENWDSIRIGFVDLMADHPYVSWHTSQFIHVINCDQIMVGSQPLEVYYNNTVKMRNVPGMWWRDSTAMYYELRRGYTTPKTVSDGSDDNSTDYPQFKSESFGLYLGEVNVMVDVDGNQYVAISGGAGYIGGYGYTEGYLCRTGLPCYTLTTGEIEQAITGWCLGLEVLIITGVNLSTICNGYKPDLSKWSEIYTYYLGMEAGAGVGLTLTLPLSWFGVAPEPAKGWRWALVNQQNSVTYNKILAWEGTQ